MYLLVELTTKNERGIVSTLFEIDNKMAASHGHMIDWRAQKLVFLKYIHCM